MHGYQVASELERLIAGGRYNSAQIYQGLHALEERGFIIAAAPSPARIVIGAPSASHRPADGSSIAGCPHRSCPGSRCATMR
jgi:hypothetical protein